MAEDPGVRRARLLERVSVDLAEDRHWLAKRRLTSWLRQHGHDDAALVRLGEVLHAMRDDWDAGRHWLVSSAEGESVERAVEDYVSFQKGSAEAAARCLPKYLRLRRLEDYPAAARARIEKLGLVPFVLRAPAEQRPPPDRSLPVVSSENTATVLAVGCLLLMIAGGFLCLLGAREVLSWVF